MEKFEKWFNTLNQKLEKVGSDVIAVRGELSDIRLCKLAIERVDEKFESISPRR